MVCWRCWWQVRAGARPRPADDTETTHSGDEVLVSGLSPWLVTSINGASDTAAAAAAHHARHPRTSTSAFPLTTEL